jgi:hypothetical protein
MWQKERVISLIPFMKNLASWFWIAEPLFLALLFFTFAAVIRQKILCYASIVAASLFFSFAVAEIYFSLPSIKSPQGELHSHGNIQAQSGDNAQRAEQGAHVPDPVLGYAPNPHAQSVAARRVKDNEVLYDVVYTTDEEGRRITPDRGDKADTAVLFLGCSFTVGDGLNDQETFAWQLGEILGEKFQVYNYGISGHGAHHMLGLVESGRLDALAGRYKQIYVFYLTSSWLPIRCLGYTPFHMGPRYILENGALKYAGKFSHTVDRLFAHSRTYAQVKSTYYHRFASERALKTHVAIIAKAMHELNARYHAHFAAIIWPDFTFAEPMLQAHGVRTLPLSHAMPDYASAPAKYTIKGDGHPNALANSRIALTLSEYILKTTAKAQAQQ